MNEFTGLMEDWWTLFHLFFSYCEGLPSGWSYMFLRSKYRSMETAEPYHYDHTFRYSNLSVGRKLLRVGRYSSECLFKWNKDIILPSFFVFISDWSRQGPHYNNYNQSVKLQWKRDSNHCDRRNYVKNPYWAHNEWSKNDPYVTASSTKNNRLYEQKKQLWRSFT